MAEPITEDRLREIATSDSLVLAICATMGGPSWSDVRAIAAELLAARARIAKLEQEPPMQLVDCAHGLDLQRIRDDLQSLNDCRKDNKRLRAQMHADDQRAWETLGRPEGTFSATNVQRLCAEVERMRGIIDDIEVESGYGHFLNDEQHEPPHLPDHVRAIVQERDAARAEVERLRSRVGWLNHLDTPEGRAMHATEAARVENEQLRADLREAMELLRWASPDMNNASWDEWGGRANLLLAKHKETP